MSRVLALVLVVAGCDAGAKAEPPVKAQVPVAPPAQVAPAIGEHVLLASIERGPCYGTCPVYTFTVYRDGKIEYEGKDFVKTKGKAGGTLTAAQLAALDKLFTDDHYLAYNNEYTHYDVTDAPSVKTSYRPLGADRTKTVDHYGGDMKAPDSLSRLEASFDTTVAIDKWIGTRAERDKLTER